MKERKNLLDTSFFNLHRIFPKFFQVEEEKVFIKKTFPDYIDPTKTKEEKIKLEKRRRNQVYKTLDYVLSLNTYYDFFSADAFKVVQNSKDLAQIVNAKVVSTDFLLLAFFSIDSNILKILNRYNIKKEVIEKIICDSYVKVPKTFKEKIVANLTSSFRNFICRSPINLGKMKRDQTLKNDQKIFINPKPVDVFAISDNFSAPNCALGALASRTMVMFCAVAKVTQNAKKSILACGYRPTKIFMKLLIMC